MTMEARVIDRLHNNPPSDSEIVLAKLSDEETALRKDMDFGTAPDVIADEQEAGSVTQTLKDIKTIISTVGKTHKKVKEPYLECGRIVDAWKNRLEAELTVINVKFGKSLSTFLDKKAEEERKRQIEAAKAERERAEALALEAQAHSEAGIEDTANELMDAAVSTEIMAERMEEKVHTATPSQLFRARSVHGSTASQKLVWVGEIKNISAIDLNQLRAYITNDDLQKAINAFVRDGGRTLDGVLIEQKKQLAVR